MNLRRKRRLRLAVSFAVATGLGAASFTIGAVEAAGAPGEHNAAVTTPRLRPARPFWIELTLAQREALKPLADDWEHLDIQTKKKWVEIANRYPKMQPDEQVRTQQRMREWAMLTPDQRRVARDSFARVRAMNPDQRADMLRKYRELPAEKRRALTTEGQASKVIVVPKTMPVPVPRRVQLSEGARVRNPAIAAQKGASPIVAAARKAEVPKPSVPAGAAATPVSTEAPVPPPAAAPTATTTAP